MALTYTHDADGRQNLGPSGILTVTTIQPAASDYPTGGYLIPASQFDGLSRVRGVMAIGYTGTAIGYLWHWNKTTGKLEVFQAPGGTGSVPTFTGTPATLTGTNSAPTITTLTNAGTTAPVYVNGGALTETTGATGITGVQAPVLTMNAYTPAGTISAATSSAGAFTEVPNGTDLSGGTATLLAYGW